jgi:FKBP-type peptidyl-prolyl cis-trans isomerase FklB
MIDSTGIYFITCIFAPQPEIMKPLMILSVLICLSFAVRAQPTTVKPKTTATKPAPAKPVPLLKTLNDSVSYSVGTSVANFYKQQGVKKLNTSLVSKAINDILAGKPALLDETTANAVMNKYMSQLQEQKAKGNINTGEAFLKQNKLRPGVKITGSGLQYEIIKDTTGEKPTAADSVTCHYKGMLVDGTEFDNSFSRGQPVTFSLRGVIPGWTEGLQLMSIGSRYKFYIPYQLGWGAFDYNSIPGGSATIFEVELLAIKKVPAVPNQ